MSKVDYFLQLAREAEEEVERSGGPTQLAQMAFALRQAVALIKLMQIERNLTHRETNRLSLKLELVKGGQSEQPSDSHLSPRD